jgi:hypothetical protein
VGLPLCGHFPGTALPLRPARGRRDEMPGTSLSPPSADGRALPANGFNRPSAVLRIAAIQAVVVVRLFWVQSCLRSARAQGRLYGVLPTFALPSSTVHNGSNGSVHRTVFDTRRCLPRRSGHCGRHETVLRCRRVLCDRDPGDRERPVRRSSTDVLAEVIAKKLPEGNLHCSHSARSRRSPATAPRNSGLIVSATEADRRPPTAGVVRARAYRLCVVAYDASVPLRETLIRRPVLRRHMSEHPE